MNIFADSPNDGRDRDVQLLRRRTAHGALVSTEKSKKRPAGPGTVAVFIFGDERAPE